MSCIKCLVVVVLEADDCYIRNGNLQTAFGSSAPSDRGINTIFITSVFYYGQYGYTGMRCCSGGGQFLLTELPVMQGTYDVLVSFSRIGRDEGWIMCRQTDMGLYHFFFF